MSNLNALKSMSYDNPAYLGREVYSTIMTAGSGGVSAKFVAHTNLILQSLTGFTTTAGTSTYTATNTLYYNSYAISTDTTIGKVFGTATSALVHVNSSQLSLIRITNTATFGAAPSLSTTTIGPFYADQFYTNGTATGLIGAAFNYALNTSTGTAGVGGILLNAGDQFYVVNGTDASHVALIAIDALIQPNAAVTA
jgi:hypothetical protein